MCLNAAWACQVQEWEIRARGTIDRGGSRKLGARARQQKEQDGDGVEHWDKREEGSSRPMWYILLQTELLLSHMLQAGVALVCRGCYSRPDRGLSAVVEMQCMKH